MHGIENVYIKAKHLCFNIPLNTTVCEDNLLTFNRIAKQHGLWYWLSEGTALGVIRDNKCIDWDDDVDVGFMVDQKELFLNKVLPDLKKNGFVIGLIFNNGNFYGFVRNGEKLDVDIVDENGKCQAGKTSNAKTDKCVDLLPYLQNIKQVTFLNEQFNVPGTDYLEFLYGPDWNIPKKSKFTSI